VEEHEHQRVRLAHLGRLIRLRRYNSSNQLQLDINYAYDGFGRRVKHWGTGVTDHLNVWNGWELLAQTDMNGNATQRFTHHPEGLDFPLAMREGSTTSLFHLDAQGNVYLLTDTSGTRRSAALVAVYLNDVEPTCSGRSAW
jgi:hypothetical protein